MLDWSRIEKYYDQGNTAGYALAFLEAERLLRQVLAEKNFPGRSTDQQLALAKKFLSSAQLFEQARALVKQIIDLNLPKHINQQAAEQILRVYFTAATELSQVPTQQIRKDRLNFWLELAKRKTGRALLYAILIILLVLAATAFINDTALGRQLASKLIALARLVLYRALPLALAATLALVAVVGISLNRRRRKHAQQHSQTTIR